MTRGAGPAPGGGRAPDAAATAGSFADRLADAIDRAACFGCVGLDPVLERLPPGVAPVPGASRAACADSVERFCIGALDAVAGVAPVIKPQSACFERFGWEGVRALERVCAAARERGLLVLLDAKRGDIGVTAERYADAAFGAACADAMTASAFMGPDTLEPLLAWPARNGGAPGDRGVFALVRTSNPGSDAVQSLALAEGGSVAERIASMVAALGENLVGARGWSSLGAVVAATKPADAARLRERMPRQPILVPGWGAQGGTADAVRGLLAPPKSGATFRGVVVTASRSVIYPDVSGAGGWESAIREAAQRFADELRAIA